MAITFFANIGDGTLMYGIAGVSVLFLWYSGASKASYVLFSAVLFTSVVILILKLIFLGLPGLLGNRYFNSPSGHVALSTSVLGTLTLIAAKYMPRLQRYVLFGILISIITGISITRLILQSHTITEVIVGLLVGASSILLIIKRLSESKIEKLNVPKLGLLILAISTLLYGHRMPTEHLIKSAVGSSYNKLPDSGTN